MVRQVFLTMSIGGLIAHKDCKNASKSAMGFHGFVFAG